MCGVTLMNTPIGRVVAEVMGAKEGVELTEYPSMIRVDGVRLLDFDYAELSDALGFGVRRLRLRGDQLHPLRPHGPPRRQDDPVRQPRGRRRVHRLRPRPRPRPRLRQQIGRQQPCTSKDGDKYFIVDGHITSGTASPANQRNMYGEGFIDCFYDYHKQPQPAE